MWWTGWDVALLVPWLAGFLVLTIGGERLELARVIRVTGTARVTFTAVVGLFGVGLVLSLAAVAIGVRVAGVGLLALAGWLAVHDVARRTVRQPGLTRYMASCLLAGYGWLATAGVLWLRFGTLSDGPAFDAMLHALFLGFVIGMVFAHAPVIAPASSARPFPAGVISTVTSCCCTPHCCCACSVVTSPATGPPGRSAVCSTSWRCCASSASRSLPWLRLAGSSARLAPHARTRGCWPLRQPREEPNRDLRHRRVGRRRA